MLDQRTARRQLSRSCVLLCLGAFSVEAFIPSTPTAALPSVYQRSILRSPSTFRPAPLNGLFDDLVGEPDEIDEIPPELRDEIYRAEENTPAAQGRTLRIAAYLFLTVAGVTTAFGNAFLNDLRFGDGAPSEDLAYYGFGWVADNFLFSFLLTNAIGGLLGLLGAGLCGTLAEVELRSKKENAEQIWTEMQRRKEAKENPPSRKKRNKKKSGGMQPTNKKDMTGKQRKRLAALSELMEEEPVMQDIVEEKPAESATPAAEVESKESEKDDGIMGKIKGFYDKADSMAASQALLLNKELEDRGVVDKITDESGLKVIGKEAASKLKEEKD